MHNVIVAVVVVEQPVFLERNRQQTVNSGRNTCYQYHSIGEFRLGCASNWNVFTRSRLNITQMRITWRYENLKREVSVTSEWNMDTHMYSWCKLIYAFATHAIERTISACLKSVKCIAVLFADLFSPLFFPMINIRCHLFVMVLSKSCVKIKKKAKNCQIARVRLQADWQN